jgi:hypothetical protein
MEYNHVITNIQELCTAVEVDGFGMLKKTVYKHTDCGAWITHDEKGIVLGSIVEGSDFEIAVPLEYPFTRKDYYETLDHIEAECRMAWDEANGEQ